MVILNIKTPEMFNISGVFYFDWCISSALVSSSFVFSNVGCFSINVKAVVNISMVWFSFSIEAVHQYSPRIACVSGSMSIRANGRVPVS